MSRIVDDDPPIKTGVASQAYKENWDRIFGNAPASSQDVEARQVAPAAGALPDNIEERRAALSQATGQHWPPPYKRCGDPKCPCATSVVDPKAQGHVGSARPRVAGCPNRECSDFNTCSEGSGCPRGSH